MPIWASAIRIGDGGRQIRQGRVRSGVLADDAETAEHHRIGVENRALGKGNHAGRSGH